MNIESFRAYCLAKPGADETFPFGPDTLVFKVRGKMFALTNLENFEGVNLKVDPEYGAELRERYEFIIPAYHMNKKHWITVQIRNGVPVQLLRELIDQSYNLVVSGLSKSEKLSLGI
ncbi:MAG: MmcQ/YjbR family DNA-binding protein [Cyclobacteriaceae bacterium]|nr:MmcQ-like protein [Cytophagales bacterium]HNP76812.1 MmcQ/YjbR family DNA-binding protein [Cyclobacteriaceae bacterium]